MSIFRRHKTDNFSIISNHCLRRDDISWKAKGIYAYLMSLPDDWELRQVELVTHATDGKAAVRAGITELELAGYVTKQIARSADGKTLNGWDYNIYEFPHQDAENQMSDNQTSDNQPLLKTDLKPKTNNTKDDVGISFLKAFNEATGRRVTVFGPKAMRQYNALLKSGHSQEDIIAAAKSCSENEFFQKKGNLKYLTPEYITRADKFSVYFDDNPSGKRAKRGIDVASV